MKNKEVEEMGENKKVQMVNDLFFSKQIAGETFIFCNQNRLRNSVDITEFVNQKAEEEKFCSELIMKDLMAIINPDAAKSEEDKDQEKVSLESEKQALDQIQLSDDLSGLKLMLFQQRNKLSDKALEVCINNKINTVGDLTNLYNRDKELDELVDTSRSLVLQLKEFLFKFKTSAHIFVQDISIEELPKPKASKKAAPKKAVAKRVVVADEVQDEKKEAATVKEKSTSAKKKSILDETPTQIIEQVSVDQIDFENFGENPLSLFVKLNKLNSQIFQSCAMQSIRCVGEFLELKEQDPQLKKLGIRLPKLKAELKKFIEFLENPNPEKEEKTEEKTSKGQLELDVNGKPKDCTIESLQKRNVISSSLQKFLSANSLDRLTYVVHYYTEYKTLDHLIGYNPEVNDELKVLMEEYHSK